MWSSVWGWQGVLPPKLLKLLNRDLRAFEHLSERGVDQASIRADVFQLLYRLILRIASKPIVTRFFLFTECIFALVLMDLLQIPKHIFEVCQSRPREQNIKRLQRVAKFFSDAKSSHDLRKAALCLQLTLHAVSMTSKTATRRECEPPLIVLLADGKVQKQTSLTLQQLIPKLTLDPSLNFMDVLLGLLTTEGHIIIRFSAYNAYPFKLWLMCKVYNPLGYLGQITSFLNSDDRMLDVGYSLRLKKEALAEGTIAEAADYLMSPQIQDELRRLCESISANSLQAERKINQDKKTETTRTSGVPRASRNSILQRYRLRREQAVEQSIQNYKIAWKNRTMNLRALAIQRMPQLWERAKGKLWWQEDVAEADRRSKLAVGDEDLLKAFISEHYEELRAEAAQLRASAKKVLSSQYVGGLPLTNGQWISWLENNWEKFQNLLREASADRQKHAQRMHLHEKGALPPATRLLPVAAPAAKSAYYSTLLQCKSGFHALLWGADPGQRLVLFTCSLWQQIWGWPLEFIQGNTYVLRISEAMCDAFKPLSALTDDLMRDVGSDSVHVYALEMAKQNLDELVIQMRVVSFRLVEWTPAKSRAGPQGTSDELDVEFEDEGNSESEMRDVENSDDEMSESSGDKVSLCSDVEAAVEQELEEPASASDASISDAEVAQDPDRVKMGTHTVFNNGYFTLSNDKTCWPGTSIRKYDDCKIRVLPRWAKDGEMGKKDQSKNARFDEHADDPENPVKCYMVLRAWMIQRFQAHHFHEARTCRKKTLAKFVADLRRDITDLGVAGGGTGNAKADAKIRLWAPDALQ